MFQTARTILYHKCWVLYYGLTHLLELSIEDWPKYLFNLLVHDWSKFRPCEFIGHMQYHGYPVDDRRDIAFSYHLEKTNHHWQNWINEEMPLVYLLEMISDWQAVSKSYPNKVPIQQYWKELHKSGIHQKTQIAVSYFIEGLAK